jgi:hypothetical protein
MVRGLRFGLGYVASNGERDPRPMWAGYRCNSQAFAHRRRVGGEAAKHPDQITDPASVARCLTATVRALEIVPSTLTLCACKGYPLLPTDPVSVACCLTATRQYGTNDRSSSSFSI